MFLTTGIFLGDWTFLRTVDGASGFARASFLSLAVGTGEADFGGDCTELRVPLEGEVCALVLFFVLETVERHMDHLYGIVKVISYQWDPQIFLKIQLYFKRGLQSTMN